MAPWFAKSRSSPGWPIDARSGGLPPWIAVARIVGVLSPPDVYFAFTFG